MQDVMKERSYSFRCHCSIGQSRHLILCDIYASDTKVNTFFPGKQMKYILNKSKLYIFMKNELYMPFMKIYICIYSSWKIITYFFFEKKLKYILTENKSYLPGKQ